MVVVGHCWTWFEGLVKCEESESMDWVEWIVVLVVVVGGLKIGSLHRNRFLSKGLYKSWMSLGG